MMARAGEKTIPLTYVECVEQKLLNEARELSHSVEEVGTVSQRAPVGHGERGL